MTPRHIYQLVQAALIVLALTIVFLNNFIYAWSGNSEGTAWFAAKDESVFQHVKNYLWPWICILLSADIVWALSSSRLPDQGLLGAKRHAKQSKNDHPATRVSPVGPSVLYAVTANFTALISTMCTVTMIFAIIHSAMTTNENLPWRIVSIILAGALGMGPVRLFLLDYPQVAQWLLLGFSGLAVVTFFTYPSVKDAARTPPKRHASSFTHKDA
jgi:hypothetical protein